MAKYIINHNTEEVHRTAERTRNCRIPEIHATHREDTDNDGRVAQLIRDKYNGCYWCYRSQHTG
ncbi:hypothetical protein SAMN04488054_13718 [Salibacterium qingdaonense]|uniref:Uncharacterized protein n=1 Tax=Salibacterium qingdaonense TaxID=266892 RepID=A0A1I4Q741_9BACI|nr:hypothetical protein SAMN04488054_13718 [Salibacterium qingdaonense]